MGKVPPALKNKELEGNLAIVNGTYICFYTNFVNIDRSAWALLPMGLFTDSLLKINEPLNEDSSLFTYSKKVQVQMPFAKASAVFSKADLKKTFDSLKISFFNIRKIDIRAYSSVEGSEKVNNSLMKQRADAMVQALLQYQPSLQNIHILTAENWLDFYKDIENSAFNYLRDFSKAAVKQKLADTSLLLKIEPLLANERKVIATLYIEDKSPAAVINDSSLLQNFDQAVAVRNIEKARLIQKEIAERIIDKRIPLEFIHKLEVPLTKEFSPLLNDREVYKYLLRATTEWDALENFLQLRQLDPENGRINYNICALRFFSWQYGGDTTAPKLLAKEIKQLSKQGIDSNLVKRMLINYNILSCEDYMRIF